MCTSILNSPTCVETAWSTDSDNNSGTRNSTVQWHSARGAGSTGQLLAIAFLTGCQVPRDFIDCVDSYKYNVFPLPLTARSTLSSFSGTHKIIFPYALQPQTTHVNHIHGSCLNTLRRRSMASPSATEPESYSKLHPFRKLLRCKVSVVVSKVITKLARYSAPWCSVADGCGCF